MDYVSTRNKERKVSAAYAIANGIAPDGGLYCPTAFPALTDADWKTLAESDYKGRSALNSRQVPDRLYGGGAGGLCVQGYADEKFGGADTAPVVKLGEGKNLLELWHGPTCAFKDMRCRCCRTCSLRPCARPAKPVPLHSGRYIG